MNPRAPVEAAFAAYQATRGQSPDVQDAARRRYDAAVKEHEAMEPSGIRGTRDRMGLPSRRPAPWGERSAWDPEPRRGR